MKKKLLWVLLAQGAAAVVLAILRGVKEAKAITLEPKEPPRRDEPRSDEPAPKRDTSAKRWTVAPGFRALRASEVTPELRKTAHDIAATLTDVAPGSWLPFELEGRMYGAVRTKTGWRYYVQKTAEERADDLPANVPLPDTLTH